ncbi:MAG: phosphate ABC transporter permease subunit PstC [Eubacteriales bacterium]
MQSKTEKNGFSIIGTSKTKSIVERTMQTIFFVCGSVAVLSVATISVYMIISGVPVFSKVGVREFLFSPVWDPNAGKFGIFRIILTSLTGTAFAVLIGVPIGVLTAVFLAELAPKPLYRIVRPAVELLAGIPSVIYGFLGLIVLVPVIAEIELIVFKNSATHQFTGGASLIAAVIMLAIMILPTVINVSESSLRAVPAEYRDASFGVGATHIQTIFKVLIPTAKSGIVTSIVLGIGRAIGEAMAIILVAGNVANFPLPFNSVKFLTTGIVSDMNYASGLHREALFGMGLVLFVFVMVINVILNLILKNGGERDGK